MQAAVHHEVQQSRRAAILEAAELEFADAGYDRARLEDVASRVGIRRASLLYHFKDKPSLYAAVTDSMASDIASRFDRSLAVDGSPGARLERSIDAWLDFVASRPTFVRILLRELADGATEHARPFGTHALRVLGSLLAVIREGQATGALLSTDGLQVLSAILGSSAFLTLHGPVLVSGGANVGAVLATRAQQRELLTSMLRTFLETTRPHRGFGTHAIEM